MNKRPDTGTIIAADGWRLEWDLSSTTLFDGGRVMPDSIKMYNLERGTNHISGTITHRDLDREIARFLRTHAGEQMRMEM